MTHWSIGSARRGSAAGVTRPKIQWGSARHCHERPHGTCHVLKPKTRHTAELRREHDGHSQWKVEKS
jgi:hypothetical protein